MKKDWKDYCLNPEKVVLKNDIRFLNGAEEFFSCLIRALKGADRFILMEFYIFSDDYIGNAVAEILKEKAVQGVKVFLIYDSAGSVETADSFFENMKKSGIQIAQYHPLKPWKPHWNWFNRNHKKTVCVDGEEAFLGGFNINVNSAPKSLRGKGWQDCAVKAKGEIVALIEKEFWVSWFKCRDKKAAIKSKKENMEGNIPAELVFAGGVRNSLSIRRNYKYAIQKAKESVYIKNAYFLPDRLVYRRLLKAAKRGIDIKIMIPGKTDHPYVKWALAALYKTMLKNGIEIYEWKGAMMHSKMAVIDGFWVSVGSHNLDHRSLYYNLEMNINIFDETFGSEVKKIFLGDLKNCKKITMADCAGRRFLSKAASKALYLFKSWL